MKSTTAIAVLLFAAGIATAGGLAWSKTAGAENDAVADLAKAKITLVQAVSVAEAYAGGKATKAELEGEGASVVFDVEVATADSKVFDVKVDAADGKVLSSRLDQADHGEKDDD